MKYKVTIETIEAEDENDDHYEGCVTTRLGETLGFAIGCAVCDHPHVLSARFHIADIVGHLIDLAGPDESDHDIVAMNEAAGRLLRELSSSADRSA